MGSDWILEILIYILKISSLERNVRSCRIVFHFSLLYFVVLNLDSAQFVLLMCEEPERLVLMLTTFDM